MTARPAPSAAQRDRAAVLGAVVPVWLRTDDLAVEAGQLLLLATGAMIVATAPFLGGAGVSWHALTGVCGTLLLVVGASLWVSWSSLPHWVSLAFPATTLAALAMVGLTTSGVGDTYVGVIPLLFVYVGVFHGARAAAPVVPLAWGADVAMVGSVSAASAVRLVVYGAVWLAIAALLAAMVARQRAATGRLEAAALTDTLTTLGNRRGLDARLATLVPGDCVVICDLDHFKAVNDTRGHAAGDAVLALFGATLTQHLRRRDYAARYGGEEFVLVLARTDPAQALAALSSLRAEWIAAGAGVTFSAGLAMVDGERTSTAVLSAADSALYRAKTAGRDRFRVDTPDAPTLVPTAPSTASPMFTVPVATAVDIPAEVRRRAAHGGRTAALAQAGAAARA